MRRMVLKFGGSSLRDAEHLRNAAAIIGDTYREGSQVVVVLSAQGDTTDELIAKAKEIDPSSSGRELDLLLSVGEQISISLCAMVLETMGLPAVSLTAWQAGIHTNDYHGNAHITKIDPERICQELDRDRIVLVAGFQGIDRHGDITTLGRGGSDTSAVALASVLHADACRIYTDVDGVFTADPRLVPDAVKLTEVTYDEMLELSSQGAQVLHDRSVELAKKHQVKLEVLSSLEKKPGTRIRERTGELGHGLVGVTKDAAVDRITVLALRGGPETAFRLFSRLSQAGIDTDMLLQSSGCDGSRDIRFIVPRAGRVRCTELLQELGGELSFAGIAVEEQLAKVSVVGAGIQKIPGLAAKMFAALYDAKVNIYTICTNEAHVSILVDEDRADDAVRAIHGALFSRDDRY